MEKNFDLHCDLTSYLAETGTSVDGDIRCSLPNLKRGNVKFQVMAFYSSTEKGSTAYLRKQLECYHQLLAFPDIYEFHPENLEKKQDGMAIIAAVENASGLCEEGMPAEMMFENFNHLLQHVKIMYVGLTHHTENRFGGGNFSEAGLKDDGKRLIDYLHNRKIAIDLSHTSDSLAFDMLNYIDKNNLRIPVLASHSNMRSVFSHKRNLPDELVLEIIRRGGLIGLNFVKYFINPENAEEIYSHIDYAFKLGAENHLCYGADFFDDKAHTEKERYPFFFPELGSPDAYTVINKTVAEKYSEEIKNKLSHKNVEHYFERLQHF